MFREKVGYIRTENARNGIPYHLEVNCFADLTLSEVIARYTGRKPKQGNWSAFEGQKPLGVHRYSGISLAASVDWRTKGAVTGLKNQQQCGSCWAFSATGAMEGAWQIATGQLVPLSEQQLNDCETDQDGCSGGIPGDAFQWVEGQTMCTEDGYPYTGNAQQCQASGCAAGIPQGGVAGLRYVDQDENALMEAVSQQPVSVSFAVNDCCKTMAVVC